MLNNKEMAELVYQGSILLEERSWARGFLGKSADRLITDREDSSLYGDGVTHLCAEGAIYAAAGKFAIPEAREVMGAYLRRKGSCLFEFNDDAKSKGEVLLEMREFAVSLLSEHQAQEVAA